MPFKDDERHGIPTSMNHQLIQQALGFGDSAIAAQRNAATQSLGRIEQSMYDIIGRNQLQSERDISQRRMQAVRSGMSSSQLAALELQNIQASQIGAQQIAQQYDMQREEMMREFAGAEDLNRQYMAQMLNENMTTASAIDAQRLQFDVGEQFRSALGSDVYDKLSAKEKTALIMMQSGIEIDGSLQKALMQKLGIVDDVPTPEIGEIIKSARDTYTDLSIGSKVIDPTSLTSSSVGVGKKRTW